MTDGAAILVVMWLAVLAYQDCRHRRLPNVLTVGGALFALVWRFGSGGVPELMSGVWGGIVCGLFLLLPFILHAAGGGDIKMLFAVGCAMGLRQVPTVILFTSFAGLLVMVVLLVWGHADPRRLKHCFRTVFDWRYDRKAGAAALPPKTNEKCCIPFGVAIALGTWVTILFDISMR